MKSQLFIPQKIKVGFQKRENTYTKRLAYVIYYDEKNVLRKEKSWSGWRDKTIEPEDYDNKPIEGFVINRNVGGVKQSYGWNTRNEYVRIFDPRGFEFEISVANLLFILQESNSIKGKGLEGQFIYCWNGTELALLPTSCSEYEQCLEYTTLQSGKVGVKDLQPGFSYKTKKQVDLIYLGKFDWYFRSYKNDKNIHAIESEKKYIFIDKENKIHALEHTKTLASINSHECVNNYSELMDILNKDIHIGYPIEFSIKPVNFPPLLELKNKYHGINIYTAFDNNSYKQHAIRCRGNDQEGLHYEISNNYNVIKANIVNNRIHDFKVERSYNNYTSFSYENFSKLSDIIGKGNAPQFVDLFIKLNTGHEFPINRIISCYF